MSVCVCWEGGGALTSPAKVIKYDLELWVVKLLYSSCSNMILPSCTKENESERERERERQRQRERERNNDDSSSSLNKTHICHLSNQRTHTHLYVEDPDEVGPLWIVFDQTGHTATALGPARVPLGRVHLHQIGRAHV